MSKGDSTVHILSPTGKSNYEEIKWTEDKCPNLRNIGKGRIVCVFDTRAVCPSVGTKDCWIRNGIVDA